MVVRPKTFNLWQRQIPDRNKIWNQYGASNLDVKLFLKFMFVTTSFHINKSITDYIIWISWWLIQWGKYCHHKSLFALKRYICFDIIRVFFPIWVESFTLISCWTIEMFQFFTCSISILIMKIFIVQNSKNIAISEVYI